MPGPARAASHPLIRILQWLIPGLLLGGLGLSLSGGYIHAKAILSQYLIRSAWEEAMATGEAPKPWPWADTRPVARLSIPALGVQQVVLYGDHGQALAFGPGYSPGSVEPGEPGVILISGHRDTHFDFIYRLEPQARIRLETIGGGELNYRVAATRIVPADATIAAPEASHQLVLVTCWPFDALNPGTPWRYLVIAEPE